MASGYLGALRAVVALLVLAPAAAAVDPNATDFCGWLGSYNRVEQCQIVSDVEIGISRVPLVCNSPAAKGTPGQYQPQAASPSGTPLPAPLADLRPLPPSLNASTVAAEGGTYAWHYRVIRNLEIYTTCSPSNGGNSAFLVPTGWRLLSMLSLPQSMAKRAPRNTSKPLPFVAVLHRKATRELVIAIRGTLTAFEWDVDFTYNQTARPLLGGVPTHAGFTWVLDKLFPAIWSLARLQTRGRGGAASVTVSGHSLGGGVASLVAYGLYQKFQGVKETAKWQRPIINAVLFAPPNAGTSEFVTAFNAAVNARRLAFASDLVPQVPCPPTMVACGNTPVPTNQPGDVKSWPYAQVGASIRFGGGDMPIQQGAWSSLGSVPLSARSENFLWATHVCSYLCFTSQFVLGDANNACLLLADAAAAGANSYCTSFPTTPPYP